MHIVVYVLLNDSKVPELRRYWVSYDRAIAARLFPVPKGSNTAERRFFRVHKGFMRVGRSVWVLAGSCRVEQRLILVPMWCVLAERPVHAAKESVSVGAKVVVGSWQPFLEGDIHDNCTSLAVSTEDYGSQ